MMFLPNNDVNLSVRQQFACPCETQLKHDVAGVCHQPQFKLYWGRQGLLLPPEIHSPFSFQRIPCPGPSKKYMTLADVLLGEMSIFTRQRTPSTPLVECCSALTGSDHQFRPSRFSCCTRRAGVRFYKSILSSKAPLFIPVPGTRWLSVCPSPLTDPKQTTQHQISPQKIQKEVSGWIRKPDLGDILLHNGTS